MSVNRAICAGINVLAEYKALGVVFTKDEPNAKGWVPCHAYGREDNNASAAVNLETGTYKDSARLGDVLSLWEFAAKVGRFASWKEARRFYAEQAGTPLAGKKKSAFIVIDDVGALLWAAWKFSIHRPGISPEAPLAAGARLVRHELGLGCYVCLALPIYAASHWDHPCGWVLMNTAGNHDKLAPLPTWNRKTKQYDWVKIKTVAGSDSGIMGEVHKIATAELIWKTEGPSDGLALISSIPPERRSQIAVVWNAGGANEYPAEWFAKMFAGKTVNVIHDADAAGEAGRKRWAAAFARHATTREVVLPYPVSETKGKDLRDWLAEGFNYDSLVELVPKGIVAAAELAPIEHADDPHRLARIFLDRWCTLPDYGVRLRYWRGQWYEWNGLSHVLKSTDDLRADVNRACKAEFDRLNLHQQKETKGQPPEVIRVTRTIVYNVIAALESMCAIDSQQEQPFWLSPICEWPAGEIMAMKDALVHLPSLVDSCDNCTIEPTDQFFSLAGLPFHLNRTPPQPEKWLKFLVDQWPDDAEAINLLQEWMGYCLLPDTSMQRMMMLLGPPRSGKGTIVRVMTALVGPPNTVTPQLSDFSTTFGKQSLLGKTLAFVSDARLSSRPDLAVIVENLLAISGEDLQTVQRKFLEPVVTQLKVRFTIVSNEMPRLPDDSGALAGRFLILNTTTVFNHSSADKSLFRKLEKELPSILMWAVAGWARLRGRGYFHEPASSLEHVADLHRLTSDVQAWAGECCVVDRDAEIATKALYENYVKWAQANGVHPCDSRLFGRKLRAAFPRVKKTRQRVELGERVMAYVGIRLLYSYEDSTDMIADLFSNQPAAVEPPVYSTPPPELIEGPDISFDIDNL